MKFDVLLTRVYDRKMNTEKNLEIAHATLREKFEEPLRGYAYPPCAYVRFECLSFTLSGADLGTYTMSSYSRGRQR